MIPKVIHYCWFGPKPFSRTVRKCIATWHKHLSDYEFRLWNEESCAAYATANGLSNPMDHPFVKSAYAARKYAFVADYVRFWALYHCGGVYLDTDMYVVRSFDNLLNNDLFVGWETKEKDYINVALFAVSPNNICVKDILDMYDTLSFDINQLDKFIVPRLVSNRIICHPNTTIYSHDYFYPLPYAERFVWRKMKYNTSNTYAVHLWDISWGKWQAKMRDQIIFILKNILRKQKR